MSTAQGAAERVDRDAVTVIYRRLLELHLPAPSLDIAHDLVDHLRRAGLLAEAASPATAEDGNR